MRARRRRCLRVESVLLGLLLAAASACTSMSMVRLQPETVDVGSGLRPIAGIQSNATAFYVLFIEIGPDVTLDRVVNRMLVVRAKTIGADKITNLQFEATPDGGIWRLRRLLGWRSAQASGIAVQVTALPADPGADQGPEAPAATAPK